MRVLHINTHCNVGGITNYILTLSRRLKDRGVEVVIASSGGDLETVFEDSGIRHRRLNINTKFEFGPKAIMSGFKIAGIVKNEGIDLIHAHSRVSQVASSIASALTGVGYVTTCHGYFNKRSRGIIDTWGSKVIAISQAVRKHLIEDLDVKPERVELIYSGVDETAFSMERPKSETAELKRALGLGAGPVIGTIGRLSPVKGQRYLISAMKEVLSGVPDAECLIIGSGPEESSLKTLVKDLGLSRSVKFIASCTDTHKYLSAMDLFVFPSVKEGLGIALLEAMASGLACIASKTGGIEDVITDGVDGMLVGVGDVSSMAKAISRLAGDPDLRADLGEHAQAVVRNRFTVSSMADNVAKFYKETVKS